MFSSCYILTCSQRVLAESKLIICVWSRTLLALFCAMTIFVMNRVRQNNKLKVDEFCA